MGKGCKLAQTQNYSHENPIKPSPVSPMYATEVDRFNRDVSGVEHMHKEQELAKKEEVYGKRRDEFAVKEKARWDGMEAARTQEEQRFAQLRSSGAGGKQNKSSEHFDIISLNYHQTREGQQLQYKDDTIRYRAILRAQNLFEKNHSVPHNLITGEIRHNPVNVPPAPVAPWDK